MDSLGGAQFAPDSTYLNTASSGLTPARSAAAMKAALDAATAGGRFDPMAFEAAEEARAGFAALAGIPARRVALGGSVAVFAGLIATSLPPGAEVLLTEGDFSSLVNPFFMRRDLKPRTAPLEELAEAVRPGTALVATSLVQSADGRIADLDAIGAAARAHGARTLVDASQAVGWLPTAPGQADFTVCVGYKWLMCQRGTAFLTVPDDLGDLTPVFAGWTAGEKPWDSCYGPVEELAHSARRYDESPALLSYVGARHSLDLIRELGVDTIAAHDRALADRFRAGLAELGHPTVPAPGSAIVAVPGLGHVAPRLAEEGLHLSDRAGNLRAAFHLYNTSEDVDRLLELLSRLTDG